MKLRNLILGFRNLLAQTMKAFLGLLVTLVTEPTIAAIPGRLSDYTSRHPPLVESFVFVGGPACSELNLAYIASLSEMVDRDLHLRVEDYLPMSMSASTSEAHVAREIIGHTVEKWASSNDFAQRTLGQTLKSIEKPLSSEMTHKDASGVEHSVQFKVNASRAVASVTYSGYVKASLDYHVADQSLGVEISRPHSQNQKWIFNHSHDAGETRDIVGYQIQF